jgi:hypothetical protein
MALTGLSVDGPSFAERVRDAHAVVRRLEENNWDFKAAPEAFAPRADADVVAKEIAVLFDGHYLTRIGRLVMGGIGTEFNLMGPIPARSELRVTDSRVLDTIQTQLGTRGLREFDAMAALDAPQKVDFYNYTMFYRTEDLVFWSVLNGAGCFPSTLEHMARRIDGGDILQNVVYRPSRVAKEGPVMMEAACLMVGFPTETVEWMDRPLYGGFAKETMHIEYLLTPERTDVSHPYLPLVNEGVIDLDGRRLHIRHFEGTSPKDGLRGLDVPFERAE